MVRGNKGEWSEFYTFIKLLADRRLSAAGKDLEVMEDIFYPVLKVIREESGHKTIYELSDSSDIKIIRSGGDIVLVDGSDLGSKAVKIFNKIKESSETTFSIPFVDELMERFFTNNLNAGNSRKEDIILQIHDYNTNTKPEIGFSIKSMLGSPSTLLNASGSTNFIYKVMGFDETKIDLVNSVDGRSKIRDRLSAIIDLGGVIVFDSVSSEIFERNLRRIDTILPEILAELILSYYQKGVSKLPELIEDLAENNPAISGYSMNMADYEFKIKSLLHNIALGMVPGREWNGLMHADGGYIIVKENGEIVCYHVYNADHFRDYLYMNTKLETPSTSRHGFGVVYKQGKDIFIKLNLQIRFIR